MAHPQARCPAGTVPRQTPLEQLCGPHSGFDPDHLGRRAQEVYERTRTAPALDVPRAGTVPQVAPAWPDLPEDARRQLVDARARYLLRVLAAPPPEDRRPVDHAHHLSPPYPDGELELEHWLVHCRRRLDDVLHPADDVAGPTTPYERGRAERLAHLVNILARRRGHAEATGQRELARLIVAATNAAATPLTEPVDELLAGARHEVVHLLEAMQARQRNRAEPGRWRRGGAALLQAVLADDTARHALPMRSCAAVIAAVDVDEDATVAATLHRLTGESPEACAAAVDHAVDAGLLRRPLLGDVVPTRRGRLVYRWLLDRVA